MHVRRGLTPLLLSLALVAPACGEGAGAAEDVDVALADTLATDTAADDALPDDTTSADDVMDVAGADTASADGTASAVDTTAGGPTWDDGMSAFFVTYCVACHDAHPKDFRLYDDVYAQRAEIRCGTAAKKQSECGDWPPPKQFPIGDGPKPSDAERQMLVDWIDAGAP